jgi:hypothetical protein
VGRLTYNGKTNLAILIFSISAIMSFSSLIFLQESYAQTNNYNSINYNTFHDLNHNISIQYPSNWIKNETQNGQTYLAFYSPETNDKNIYVANVFLTIDDQPSSFNLNDYLKNTISSYKSDSSLYKKFKVIESGTSYTLGGYPAYKLISTYIEPETGIKYELIETGIVVGSSVYYLYILVDADQYFTYLPIINNMINSFQINNATSTTPSTTTPSSQVPLVSNNMVPYTNPHYGIKMLYPSDWIKNDTQNGQIYAQFDSPDLNSKNLYLADFRLGIDNTTANLDLNSYLQNSISSYKSSQAFQNFQVIESGTNYNFAGYPAYKLIGIFTDPNSGIIFNTIETGVIVGSSVYYIYALVESDQYFNYLPIINNIINSFQINNNNNLTTSGSSGAYQTPTTNSTIPVGTITPSDQNGFNLYENPNLNIKLTYPNNWNVSENNDTLFLYPTKIDNIVPGLKPFFMITTFDASGVESSDKALLSILHYATTNKTNFTPIQSTSLKVSKDNTYASMAIYSYDDSIYGNIKEMTVVAIKGNVGYMFVFSTDQYNYQIYLPIILNMLSSLEFPNSTIGPNITQGQQQSTYLPLSHSRTG